MRKLKCLRCGQVLDFAGQEKLQLGQTGWILGDLPNLFAGALEVQIYCCPSCGKLEFYTADDAEQTEWYRDATLPSKQCPSCGKTIDFDYPKCPCCGHVF